MKILLDLAVGTILAAVLLAAGLLGYFYHSVGEWPGILVALLVAGIIYWLWYEDTRDDPVSPKQAPGTDTTAVPEAKEIPEDTNRVRRDLRRWWSYVRPFIYYFVFLVVVSVVLLLLDATIGLEWVPRLCGLLLWVGLVTVLVRTAMYVTTAYRRGTW